MRRDQLEHPIRTAGAILDEDEVIVVGSQAILGVVDDSRLPAEATRSIEADIVPLEDPDETMSTLIDGTIGELSPFHSTFGVYAQVVGQRTARLRVGVFDPVVLEERLRMVEMSSEERPVVRNASTRCEVACVPLTCAVPDSGIAVVVRQSSGCALMGLGYGDAGHRTRQGAAW